MPISIKEFKELPSELNWWPTVHPEITITKSQYMAWRRCPQLYKLQYVDCIEPEVSPEGTIGRSMHDWLAAFFDAVDYDKLNHTRSYRSAYDVLKTTIPESKILRTYTENFIDFEAKQWDAICHQVDEPLRYWKPVHIELELTVPSIGFMHHMDRIDRLTDDTYIIIEYKPKVRNGEVREELAFYVIGLTVSGFLDKPITQIGTFGYATNEARSWLVKPQLLYRVARNVNEFREAIAKGDFPCRSNMSCMWCWMNKVCEGAVIEENVPAVDNADETDAPE